MPPLNREHNVHWPFTLQKGRLSFRTGGALLAQEAVRAKDTGKDLTVNLMSADQIQEFTGRVESFN
jgi:hypothetical protein